MTPLNDRDTDETFGIGPSDEDNTPRGTLDPAIHQDAYMVQTVLGSAVKELDRAELWCKSLRRTLHRSKTDNPLYDRDLEGLDAMLSEILACERMIIDAQVTFGRQFGLFGDDQVIPGKHSVRVKKPVEESESEKI